MYGLADYFVIDNLKHYAKDRFSKAPEEWRDWDSSYKIEQLVKEIYSTRGDYELLKMPLLERIIRRCSNPRFTRRCYNFNSHNLPLDCSPEFTHDLCLKALLKLCR